MIYLLLKYIYMYFPTWSLFSHTFRPVLRRHAGPAASFGYQLTRNAMCENIQAVGSNSWLNNRPRRLGAEICRAGQKTHMCFFSVAAAQMSLLCHATLLDSNKVNVSVCVKHPHFAFFFLVFFCPASWIVFPSCRFYSSPHHTFVYWKPGDGGENGFWATCGLE